MLLRAVQLAVLSCISPLAASYDRVYLSGQVYTQDAGRPWAEAFWVRDGRYALVGDSEVVLQAAGADVEVIDLGGRFVMPALIDAHLHPVRGGTSLLYECNFSFSATPEEIQARIATCVADNPSATWIRGGQWDSGFFERFSISSPRAFLDAVSGDAAVVLSDDSHHNAWVNSRALELFGIDRESSDPPDGRYVRDAMSGEPNGILLEGAKYSAFAKLPDWTATEMRAGAREAIRTANAYGVVGLKDANATKEMLDAYLDVVNEGDHTLYLAAALATPRGRKQALDYAQLDGLRERYQSEALRLDFVKLYLDGVPTASRTAAMLHEYLPESEGADAHSGMLHLPVDLLTQDLLVLDRRGYTVKIHTAGDRSVRVALDAIAEVRRRNGDSGLRHELAHAGFIDAADLPRFAELSVVADLSPHLWYPSAIIDSIVSALGPRGREYWPVRALLEAEAPVLVGSDWPAGVPSMDPWSGIEALVTRAHPTAAFPGTLWPEQAITLEQALTLYTINGAAALGLAGETGRIREGWSADFIVLDESLFEKPAEEISETRVLRTVFQGRVVHDSNE